MADVKISELPTKTVASTDVVPVVDSGFTTTSRVTAGDIAALGGGPPASHTHGNITNAGAIGSTANLPVITGSSGVLQAGSFGSSANTFCQGNDSRLSDSRTPTAHKTSHASGGSDALTPSDIGAPASSITGISGATAVTNIVFISQANYDAIGSKSSTTMYVIV